MGSKYFPAVFLGAVGAAGMVIGLITGADIRFQSGMLFAASLIVALQLFEDQL